MRSTYELRTQVWRVSLCQLYNISTWNQGYRTTQTQARLRILNVNLIQALLDRSLMNFFETLDTSVILKYLITLHHPLPANGFFMQAPGK